MKKIIHWNEGLFLQPQHLQTFQRQVLSALSTERCLFQAHAHGVIDLRICDDSLANKRIKFERLVAILPSGTYVSLFENLTVDPVDIRERFSKKNESFNVYLGIPLFNSERANTVPGRSSQEAAKKYLYHVYEGAVADENTGQSEKAVEFLSINGRILVEGDNFDGFEVIPLFRIMQGVGENLGQPRLAPEFCGPCVMIGAFPSLQRAMGQLVEQISASRKDILRKFKAVGFNREQVQSNHLDLMLRSQILCSADVVLSEMIESGVAHPHDVYTELKKLYGELACLTPEQLGEGVEMDPLSLIEDYEHESPFLSLKVLSKRIREILGDSVIPDYLEIVFDRKDDHYVAAFEDRHFTQSDHFFIGIESKNVQPQDLFQLVEDIDVFKFVPSSMRKKVLRGVRLKEETHVPHVLPRKSYMYYFSVIPGGQGSAWNKIEKEKEAIIEWSGFNNSDFKIRLFMTTVD
ncbi:MAG: type VI secretion system baseplate subunit TssK [Opitutaceae bacterium]